MKIALFVLVWIVVGCGIKKDATRYYSIPKEYQNYECIPNIDSTFYLLIKTVMPGKNYPVDILKITIFDRQNNSITYQSEFTGGKCSWVDRNVVGIKYIPGNPSSDNKNSNNMFYINAKTGKKIELIKHTAIKKQIDE